MFNVLDEYGCIRLTFGSESSPVKFDNSDVVVSRRFSIFKNILSLFSFLEMI